MMKKPLKWFLLIVVLIIFAVFFYIKRHPEKPQIKPMMVLNYSTTCEICNQRVEQLIERWHLYNKINFMREKNKFSLKVQAVICHLNVNKIVLPMLWTGLKCIQGDQAILGYLQNLQ